MEVTRKRSNKGKLYRIMDDCPGMHVFVIEYAKTFEDKGEIIYGWYPLYEPQKTFTNFEKVKEIFEKLCAD